MRTNPGTETFAHLFWKCPFGPFAAAVDRDGALVATAFGGRDALAERLPEGSRLAGETRCEDALDAVRTQIDAYLEGRRKTFDLRLAPRGTAFQKSVWEALRVIPRGETRSYGALAAELHSSARAVGRANATNPICVVIPCHRVIGANGDLTGFAFGVEIKRRLLELEARPRSEGGTGGRKIAEIDPEWRQDGEPRFSVLPPPPGPTSVCSESSCAQSGISCW